MGGPRESVYVPGAAGLTMWYVCSGNLHYSCRPRRARGAEFRIAELGEKTFLTEIALWIAWEHFGRLTSDKPCCLIAIDAQRFQQVTKETSLLAVLQRYAQGYLRHVSQRYQQKDWFLIEVTIDMEYIQDLTLEAFDLFWERPSMNRLHGEEDDISSRGIAQLRNIWQRISL